MTLADRVEQASGQDLGLDVLCEVALFKPDAVTKACRANSAGTKVIYTDVDGDEATRWPEDWTLDRKATAAILRAHEQGAIAMTDPNEALVEELAKAIGEAVLAQDDMAAGVGLNDNLTVDWLDQGETDFGIIARAILPIIARVRDEAFNEGTIDGLDWRNEL